LLASAACFNCLLPGEMRAMKAQLLCEILNSSGGVTPGAAPGVFSASATAISTSAINLSWSQPSGTGVTFNVYRGTAPGVTIANGTLIASNQVGLTFGDTGLSASTPYYYLIVANNTFGSSNATCNATTLSPFNVALTLNNVAINGSSNSSTVSLTWPAQSGATSYSVYRSTVSGFTPGPSTLLLSGILVTHYTDSTGDVSGSIYTSGFYYVVIAVGAATPNSNQASLWPKLPQLTSATTPPGYTATALGTFYHQPWQAFINDSINGFSYTSVIGNYLKIQLPTAVTATAYCLYVVSGQASDYVFQGSPDGSTWTTLDTQNPPLESGDQLRFYNISTPGSYLYYRVITTGVIGGNTAHYFSNFQLYG